MPEIPPDFPIFPDPRVASRMENRHFLLRCPLLRRRKAKGQRRKDEKRSPASPGSQTPFGNLLPGNSVFRVGATAAKQSFANRVPKRTTFFIGDVSTC